MIVANSKAEMNALLQKFRRCTNSFHNSLVKNYLSQTSGDATL